ncbi:MAG: FecR family protein [Lyngbya sp. HA4199-MV5]|jgi:hypothetical protein|nr:FecR family protein [Lyngbya sp. HA4199-MV5]
MIIKLTYRHCVGVALLAGAFIGCSRPASDLASTALNSPTTSPTPVASSPIATISEIQNLPVFVRLLNAAQEQAAKEGMGLQTGETIRTQGKALAQIDLNNGLAFRLAGDAVLTLKPDNRLNLTSGDMITWVQPGKKLPTEIVTPVAIAGIRGTTVFVKIPQDPKEGVLFFAWEGSVAVRLPGQTEAVLLKTADEVRIKPGDRDVRQIRQRVRRMSRAEWRQKRQSDPLLRSFKKAKMSTLPIIEKIKPGEATLQPLPKAPAAVKKQAHKKQDDKKQDDKKQDGDRTQVKRAKQILDKADKADKADKKLQKTKFENRQQKQPDDDRAERGNRDRSLSKPPKRDRPDTPKPEVARKFEAKKERHSESDERHHPKHESKGRDRKSDRDH